MAMDLIIKEDMKIISEALKNSDINNANIFCNRIITDATLNKLVSPTIVGAILKDIIMDSLQFEENPDDFKKFTDKILSLINKFEEIMETQVDNLEEIWRSYLKYFDSTRDLHFLIYEKGKYQSNPEFSRSTTEFCLNFLIEDLKEVNFLSITPYGVVNELSRVYITHGANIDDLSLKILITYFGHYFEYIKILMKDVSELLVKKIENEFTTLKDQIIEIITLYLEGKKEFLRESSELLFNLCLEWRKMFIRFMEIRLPTKKERGIKLPKEAKEKIKKIVSEVTQKEVEKE